MEKVPEERYEGWMFSPAPALTHEGRFSVFEYQLHKALLEQWLRSMYPGSGTRPTKPRDPSPRRSNRAIAAGKKDGGISVPIDGPNDEEPAASAAGPVSNTPAPATDGESGYSQDVPGSEASDKGVASVSAPGEAEVSSAPTPPQADREPNPSQGDAQPVGSQVDPAAPQAPSGAGSAAFPVPSPPAEEIGTPGPQHTAEPPLAASGPAEPVSGDPLTPSGPVPVEDEAGDGEEVPDWALSPRRRAERERAREAARPKPPALVEHGPMEWHQAWRDIAPPDLVVVLARQHLSELSDGVLLEYLAAVEKATAWLQSLRVLGLGEFAGRRTEPGSPLMGAEGYEQGTVKELSAHLHQSRGTLAPQLADAVQLCGHFPATVAAMGEGRVDLGRASAIVRGSRDLPAAVLPE
jgi:hypothetical protein